MGDLTAVALSAHGDYIHCSTEFNRLISFNSASAKMEQNLEGSKAEIQGIVHHSFSNILAVWSDDGLLNLWK